MSAMKLDEKALEAAHHATALKFPGTWLGQMCITFLRTYIEAATPPDVAKIARSLEALAEHLSDQPLTHADSTDLATIRQAATALRLSAGGGWRSMESAPRDGTPILAHNSRVSTFVSVVVRWQKESVVAGVDDGEPHWADAATAGGTALYYNPLYFDLWQPLPASPAVEPGHVE